MKKSVVSVTAKFSNGDVETHIFISENNEHAIGYAMLDCGILDKMADQGISLTDIWAERANTEDLVDLFKEWEQEKEPTP